MELLSRVLLRSKGQTSRIVLTWSSYLAWCSDLKLPSHVPLRSKLIPRVLLRLEISVWRTDETWNSHLAWCSA
jgi:hypothetical protein